jgi:hypothetical protein
MSLTTLLFAVTIVIVFSGAEVLKILLTELLEPAAAAGGEALQAAPLLLVEVVQVGAIPAEAMVAAGGRDGGRPAGTR